MQVYDLSQKAAELYAKSKSNANKRELLLTVATELQISNGKVLYKLKPIFQLIADAVEATNRSKVKTLPEIDGNIFELAETPVNKRQNAQSLTERSTWLSSRVQMGFLKDIVEISTTLLRHSGHAIGNKMRQIRHSRYDIGMKFLPKSFPTIF